MKTTLGDISKQFSELKSTIESKSKGKVTKKEVKDLQSKLSEKVSLSEVQSALNSMQADLVAKFLEVNDQIKQTERTLALQLKRKANLEDLPDSTKMDSSISQTLD